MEIAARWNQTKSCELIERHGIGFEEVIIALQGGHFLDDLERQNKEKFRHQRLLVVQIEDYAYVVPYVREEEGVFFKTLFPSRKFTRQYLSE
ncbi:MAG: toxin [Hyphomicrobiaceae bacterium]|nr:toxin [Hyphomicrobiaceae bacterium]